MRISEHFGLGRSQFELDFVDIDPDRDTHLFLDPYFLGIRNDRFSVEATRSIRSFFQHFIDLMLAGEEVEARALFDYLHEPNETCLGLSKGKPRGNAIGAKNAQAIFDSIKSSRALRTGLLEHLEDCRLFIDNVDKDKVSDMTTNIIRQQLIQYTQEQCKLWDIGLTSNVVSGSYWNRQRRAWDETHTDMLIVDGKKILLIPKSVVSYAKRYSSQQYHQHFVLNYLKHEHLRMNSVLVQRRTTSKGKENVWVTKKSIVDYEAPLEKDYLTGFTAAHRDVFREFRDRQASKLHSLDNSELDPRADLHEIVSYLIDSLASIRPGNDGATEYHRTVTAILELLLYPRLTCPQVEFPINQGRKRIDITFDNASVSGVFRRVSDVHNVPCPYVMVECKNYGREIGNPEIDQLIGRFHPNRGKLGFLLCRAIADLPTLMQRCRDAYQAQQGLVIPLMDSDLTNMLRSLLDGVIDPEETLLTDRLRAIALA